MLTYITDVMKSINGSTIIFKTSQNESMYVKSFEDGIVSIIPVDHYKVLNFAKDLLGLLSEYSNFQEELKNCFNKDMKVKGIKVKLARNEFLIKKDGENEQEVLYNTIRKAIMSSFHSIYFDIWNKDENAIEKLKYIIMVDNFEFLFKDEILKKEFEKKYIISAFRNENLDIYNFALYIGKACFKDMESFKNSNEKYDEVLINKIMKLKDHSIYFDISKERQKETFKILIKYWKFGDALKNLLN